MTLIPRLAASDLPWLAVKIRRRVTTPLKRAGIRLRDRMERSSPGRAIDVPSVLPWLPEAAIPGFEAWLPRNRALVESTNGTQLYCNALQHRLTVLATEPLSVNAPTRSRLDLMRSRSTELSAAMENYHPIDWHRDFKSRHEWDPEEFYLDARVAPVPGADIKLPRELSRFQHIGALAYGPLEEAGREFLLEVLDWIVANPLRRGVNWECTMDVALRAVNWIWGLRLFEPELRRYPQLLREVTTSIYQHGVHIENNLEYYEECTGNHYLSDIAGLVYIGAAFPQFPQSDRWLLFGLQELVSEMGREVYADGGSHEASTHYHRLVADLFASCAALVERVPVARRARLRKVELRAHRVRPRLFAPSHSRLNLGPHGPLLPVDFYSRLVRMAEFTVELTKPNGLVPQFGDNDSARVHKLLPRSTDDVSDHAHLAATIGQLTGRDDLIRAGARARDEGLMVAGGITGIVAPPPARCLQSLGTVVFPDSGIAVARRGPAWLAVTCGPNGMGGRGGHGHNDKLSFELNVYGLDFIVDGGCPAYSAAPQMRNRFRSTWAHSTVAVAGMEQDPLPPGLNGLFSLPERCRPRLEVDDVGTISGSHAGYGALHRRRFILTDTTLEIEDELESHAERWLIFNLHPFVHVRDLTVASQRARCILLHDDGACIELSIVGAASAEAADGCFGRGYGVPVSTSSVRVRMSQRTASTRLVWSR
jgi:hypothetical protein